MLTIYINMHIMLILSETGVRGQCLQYAYEIVTCDYQNGF